MRKLSPNEILRPTEAELAALPRLPLVVVLDDIRSAHNVGAIFRTADAVRAARVICTGYTPTPEHRSVAKTALGAEATVPWQHVADPVEALRELKGEGVNVVALEQTTNPTPLESIGRDDFPLALVVGNDRVGREGGGLPRPHDPLTPPGVLTYRAVSLKVER